MTLKQIDCQAIEKARDEFIRLANSLDSTAKLAEKHGFELQSNQLGNLNEGLRRAKKFVVDADNRVREAIFDKS